METTRCGCNGTSDAGQQTTPMYHVPEAWLLGCRMCTWRAHGQGPPPHTCSSAMAAAPPSSAAATELFSLCTPLPSPDLVPPWLLVPPDSLSRPSAAWGDTSKDQEPQFVQSHVHADVHAIAQKQTRGATAAPTHLQCGPLCEPSETRAGLLNPAH